MPIRLDENDDDVTPPQLGLNPGDLVDVLLDDGKMQRGRIKYGAPYRFGGNGPWVAHVTGIAGCYLLCRITPVAQQELSM